MLYMKKKKDRWINSRFIRDHNHKIIFLEKFTVRVYRTKTNVQKKTYCEACWIKSTQIIKHINKFILHFNFLSVYFKKLGTSSLKKFVVMVFYKYRNNTLYIYILFSLCITLPWSLSLSHQVLQGFNFLCTHIFPPQNSYFEHTISWTIIIPFILDLMIQPMRKLKPFNFVYLV